jgi:hypothetical protein
VLAFSAGEPGLRRCFGVLGDAMTAFSVGEPRFHLCLGLLADAVVAFSVGEPGHHWYSGLLGDIVVAFSVGDPRENKRFARGDGVFETAASQSAKTRLSAARW